MNKLYTESVDCCWECPNYHFDGCRAWCNATGDEIKKRWIHGDEGFPPFCPLEDDL